MTAGPAVDGALIDMMDAVFAGHREKHPPTTTVRRDPDLWRHLDELGLVRLTGDEQYGGSGAGWNEAAELLTAAVSHGVRIPLAEHDLLACWLLDATGVPADDAARTVCVLDKQGTAIEVPWASSADRVVVVWRAEGGHQVADVAADQLTITPGSNLIGEPRDTVCADLSGLAGHRSASPSSPSCG